MSLGAVMLDVRGTALTPEEIERLCHPQVGGVILFARNFASPTQLLALTQAIRELRQPPLLIAVDHEGGRVQRFQEGFTRIPPMRRLGELWDQHPTAARRIAQQTGYVIGAELRACGVDFSFTPVLDLDYGNSAVIGNRAFHSDPQAVAELAHHLMLGLKEAGMVAVGKHFPGHGFVEADSHLAIPKDQRALVDLQLSDMEPFRQMIHFGLPAIMPAHVIYPGIDENPAGFSRFWLQTVLRQELGFDGVIFSDDLSMEGAKAGGDVVSRGRAALAAGCDMVLICNDPAAAEQLITGLDYNLPAVSLARLARMHGKPRPASLTQLHEEAIYVEAVRAIGEIGRGNAELPFDTARDHRVQG